MNILKNKQEDLKTAINQNFNWINTLPDYNLEVTSQNLTWKLQTKI